MPDIVVRLERWTTTAKIIVAQAQHTADVMRHTRTTVLHLRAAFWAEYIAAEIADAPLRVSAEGIEEFKRLGGGTEQEKLRTLPVTCAKPETAFLDDEVVSLIEWAEYQAKQADSRVTVAILLDELLRYMRKSVPEPPKTDPVLEEVPEPEPEPAHESVWVRMWRWFWA